MENIFHDCIIRGDDLIPEIEVCSILRKHIVTNIKKLFSENSEELEDYGIRQMGYGTKRHGYVKKKGFTFHRKTFCKLFKSSILSGSDGPIQFMEKRS